MKPLAVVIVVIVVVVAVITLLRSRNAGPNINDVEEMVGYLRVQAVDIARQNYSVELDYTVESINEVDDILGVLHEQYTKDGNEEGLRGLSMVYGAYVGEVIRRNHDLVHWEKDDPVGGENSYPLHCGLKGRVFL